MENQLINPDDILELMAEVGNSLQICRTVVTSPAQPEYGFDEVRSLQCRLVRGYVIPLVAGYVAPQLASQLALESGSLQVGSHVAIVSAEDMQLSDLDEGSVMVWNGLTYELKYLRGIQHRGVVMIHEIILNQTQKQQPAE